jgi:hypothetical protein
VNCFISVHCKKEFKVLARTCDATVQAKKQNVSIISRTSLINSISRCDIAQSLACKLFDHKQVSLLLNEKNNNSIPKCRLSNSHLDAKLLAASVEIAVRRAHLYSLRCGDMFPLNNAIKTRELVKIKDVMNLYGDLVTAMEKNALGGGGTIFKY